MKKCMVLHVAEGGSLKEAKKTARQLKKAHEKIWGAGTCEVVVLPVGVHVETTCEEWSGGCSKVDCPKS